MNLVLGAIYGYDWEKVKHFVISLRKHYDGKIAFIVDMDVMTNVDMINKLDRYNVSMHLYDKKLESNHEIQNNRFELYPDIIENCYPDVENVFITDVRDVIFQDDPFIYGFRCDDQELEFYYEPEKIGNCRCNSWWYKTMLGDHVLEAVKDKYIICCGTIMGTREGLLDYLKVFKESLIKWRESGRVFTGGEDTVVHNLLIYNDGVPRNYRILHNGCGAVSTLDHQQTLSFDEQGRYMNDDGRPTPVIHQWDRKKEYIELFNKIALE